MSILKEIRNQPDHIREIFMWAAVVIVFSFVFFGWIKTTENRMTALLRPQELEQERALAEADIQPSLFATIGGSVSGIVNGLTELFGSNDRTVAPDGDNQSEVEPQKLPVIE